ncbi:MAG: nickel-dependent lactate racemase [Thermoanaerobacteraceae bacterium]|nr:nickel-dependent lactate racemase [Thermoanaerobacteraceae bacterium]
MIEYSLKYGRVYVNVSMPEVSDITVLEPGALSPITDLNGAFIHNINNPIKSLPLSNLLSPSDEITIVISDVTRSWIGIDSILPLLVTKLNSYGIKNENIVILIALGTHRFQTEEEIVRLVGKDIYGQINIVQHDCDDYSNLQYIGTTSLGTEVEVNKLLLNRKVIITGGIVHHDMAGFGGGRKSILPGCASRKTIFQNHIHTMDPEGQGIDPRIGTGKLENNPLNRDMVEAMNMVGPVFLINLVVDGDGRMIGIFCGDPYAAWYEGCKFADDAFSINIEKPSDLTIVSCGGYPKDINLYQATKSLFNAAEATKEGGSIVFLAECIEGGGSDKFYGWGKYLPFDNLEVELRKHFTIDGYIFYYAVYTAQKYRVYLLSKEPDKTVKDMGFITVDDVNDTIYNIVSNESINSIYIMPHGSTTIPKIMSKQYFL